MQKQTQKQFPQTHNQNRPNRHTCQSGILVGNYQDTGEPALFPEEALKRHALFFGASGSGKTYLSYLVAREQLARGASLVVLDPKRKTIQRLRGACAEAKLPPERVVTIDAAEPENAPGFNPFRSKTSRPNSTAKAVLELFEKTGALTGDRMATFLTHAIRVAAWHGLPLGDVPRLLHDPAFLDSILSSPTFHPTLPGDLYSHSFAYFRGRFAQMRSADRDSSIQSVETKFTQLMGSELFLRLFNARENTVDFDRLFLKQGAILVSLETGGGDGDLTESDASLLAGLVIHFLFAAAKRGNGKVPVVLVVDEIRKLSGFLEEGLRDVVNMAREANVRLLAAAQHAGHLPDGVRQDILLSSAVKAYFHAKGESGEANAKDLAAATPPEPEEPEPVETPPVRVRLYARREGYHDIQPLCADYPPPRNPLPVDVTDPQWSVHRFVAYDPDARPPLYLENGAEATPLFRQFPPDHVFLQWEGQRAYVIVKKPLPPKPKRLPGRERPMKERWTGTLAGLGNGEAVFVVDGVSGGAPRVAAVTRFSPPQDAPVWFLKRSAQAARAVVNVVGAAPQGVAPPPKTVAATHSTTGAPVTPPQGPSQPSSQPSPQPPVLPQATSSGQALPAAALLAPAPSAPLPPSSPSSPSKTSGASRRQRKKAALANPGGGSSGSSGSSVAPASGAAPLPSVPIPPQKGTGQPTRHDNYSIE